MTLPREMDVNLNLIDLEDRLRDVNEAAAEGLAVSMRERGQITAIELREKQDGRYRMTDGAHRFRAAQLNEWPTIRAVVVECSDDEARLREIDATLYRADLTPFDEANFLEERRQIWERVNGQIKRGGDRRSKVQIVPLIEGVSSKARNSFVTDTAEKFGLQKITIKRALMRKGGIAPKVWAALRVTEAAKNGSLLDKIRKLSVEQQFKVIQVIGERGCTVQQAVKIALPADEIDHEMRDWDAIQTILRRATPAFIEKLRAKLEVEK
jgi:ParB family chromosome partitioning protein